MGQATFQPKWWSEEQHGSAWSRVKEAMKRDWEQTKNDFKAGGADLDQDVDDTVKQAAGKEAIPGPTTPNAPNASSKKRTAWDDVEGHVAYGYGARTQYGKQYSKWDDKLESTLRTEWDTSNKGKSFDDVKPYVRHGYDQVQK